MPIGLIIKAAKDAGFVFASSRADATELGYVSYGPFTMDADDGLTKEILKKTGKAATVETAWISAPLRICPNGKLLKTSGTVHDGRTLLYRASKRDCDVCPIRAKCCTTADARKIPRDIHEDARDIARRKMKTKAFAKSRDERKRVEMRFAHLKTHHGFERLRLRGLSGARDEFHLAAIVQNLKTLALRTLGPPTRRRASYA